MRLFTLLLFAASAVAFAATPDLTGTWKLNTSKSEFGQFPAPNSMTQKITHAEPKLTVENNMSGPQGDIAFTANYSTDGKETTNSMMGNDMKSKAVWDGKVLVITSAGNFGGADVKVTNKYSLSEDRKTLTNLMNISAPQGDFELTYVLVKQ